MLHQESFNPYTNLYPVESPFALYGRHKLIRTIIRRLTATSPLSQQLVGLSRTGKTSILNVLARLSHKENQVFVKSLGYDLKDIDHMMFVQINCEGFSIDTPVAFWQWVGQHLAKAIEKQEINDRGNIDYLQEATFEQITATLSWLNEQDFLVVCLFDDFDQIIMRLPNDILLNLRFLLEINQGHLAYVTATHKELYAYYQENNLLVSPLFNYFTLPMYVGLLEEDGPQNVEAFILEPARKFDVKFSLRDIDTALRIGGRHPDLTRLVCQALFDERVEQFKKVLNYKDIQKQVMRAFEPVFHTMMSQLSIPQYRALISLSTSNSMVGITETVWDELRELGLVIEYNDYEVFSPVLQELLTKTNRDAEPANFQVWPEQRAVKIGQKLHILSPTEWKLFEYLYQHAGQVCTREQLNGVLEEQSSSTSSLEITISRLRQKIELNISEPQFILTVRGRGYSFKKPNGEKDTSWAFVSLPQGSSTQEEVVQTLETLSKPETLKSLTDVLNNSEQDVQLNVANQLYELAQRMLSMHHTTMERIIQEGK